MPTTAASPEIVPRAAARLLLLRGSGLLGDPERPGGAGRAGGAGGAGPARVERLIEDLGFVQLDSINIVERAHHHILWTRLHAYRPAALAGLQAAGRIFEHWTHDASLIPTALFPHWRHRFERVAWGEWLRRRMGPDGEAVAAAVLERVAREGPLQARDFEHNGTKSGPWWDWKPAKAALEYWWRRGRLAVPRRERFEKVYDLTERVLTAAAGLPAPPLEQHIEWACSSALERLGVATPKELSGFWNAITAAQAQAWCAAAAREGRIRPVRAEGDERRAASFAPADWKDRASSCPAPPADMRLLSPFDPLIRDRARCERLFGFEYRFEAFTPGARRRHGYYILPILEGERLIGRLDPKLDRREGVLRVQGVWWERGLAGGRGRRRALGEALERYAALCSAGRVEMAT